MWYGCDWSVLDLRAIVGVVDAPSSSSCYTGVSSVIVNGILVRACAVTRAFIQFPLCSSRVLQNEVWWERSSIYLCTYSSGNTFTADIITLSEKLVWWFYKHEEKISYVNEVGANDSKSNSTKSMKMLRKIYNSTFWIMLVYSQQQFSIYSTVPALNGYSCQLVVILQLNASNGHDWW